MTPWVERDLHRSCHSRIWMEDKCSHHSRIHAGATHNGLAPKAVELVGAQDGEYDGLMVLRCPPYQIHWALKPKFF
jgi:hypothetical protein